MSRSKSTALVWNEVTLYLTQHTEYRPWCLCSYLEPQSVISGTITEHRPLTGLEMKLKCMLIFTTLLYKIQKITLLSDLLTPLLMHG